MQGVQEGGYGQAAPGPGEAYDVGQAGRSVLGVLGVLGDRDQGGGRVVEDPGAGLHGGRLGVDDDPQGLHGLLDPTYGQMGVVGAGGAGADNDGVGLGAQPVDVGAGLRGADPAGGAVGGGDAAVEGGGVLPPDEGPAVADGGEPGDVARPGLVLQEALLDLHAGGAQGVGTARGLRVRVADRVHDPADPGLDQRLGAGAGAAGVVAGFEGDVGGAAAGQDSGLAQGVDLGVRAAGALMEAFADQVSGGVGDDAPDDGVGAGGAETACGELDGASHGGDVGLLGHRVLLPLRARTPGPVDDDRERVGRLAQGAPRPRPSGYADR
ncbi:hypothetical protein SNARM312S_06099 [Streptomyces narbonensis]